MSYEEQMWSKWNEDEDDEEDTEWLKEGRIPRVFANNCTDSEK